jgi:hypothetical protein
VSSQSSHRVLSYTRVVVFILAFFVQVTVRAWDVDLSRRQKDLQKAQGPGLAGNTTVAPENLVDSFFDSFGPTQEVVILHTEKGFVPETVRMKKGTNYKVHIVNVDEKDKNVSFVLDAFSEHHGTLFGKENTFSISPKTEGIFSFQCPETAKQGKIIVYSDEERKPASQH